MSVSWQSRKLAGYSRALSSGLSLRATNESRGGPRPHQATPPGPARARAATGEDIQARSVVIITILPSDTSLLSPVYLFFHLQMKTLLSQRPVGPVGGAALKSPCQGPWVGGGESQSQNNRKARQLLDTHSIRPRNSHSPATRQLTPSIPAQ